MTCPASKRTTRPRATRTSVAAAGSPPKTSLPARARRGGGVCPSRRAGGAPAKPRPARARRRRALSPSRLPADVRQTCGLLAPVTPTPPAVTALLKLADIIGPLPPYDEFLRQHPAPPGAGKDGRSLRRPALCRRTGPGSSGRASARGHHVRRWSGRISVFLEGQEATDAAACRSPSPWSCSGCQRRAPLWRCRADLPCRADAWATPVPVALLLMNFP